MPLKWLSVEASETFQHTGKTKQTVQYWRFYNTHPGFAALLFPVLQAPVPAAGMPEKDQSMYNFKSASQQLYTDDSPSYQHSYTIKAAPVDKTVKG